MKTRRMQLGAAFLLVVLSASPAQAFWFGSKPSSEKQKSAPAPQTQEPGSLGLLDAYRLALVQSESVAITQKEIDLARARFYRSFDYFLPSVHFEMTRFEHDVDDDGGASGSLNFSRRTTPQNKFTFSQPIFSGFKEIAALRGSGADRQAQELRWRRAQELLFVDVMEAYYNVLLHRRDLESLQQQKKVLDDRLVELKQRIELGRSREGEMKTTTADAKLIEADLVATRLAVARAENLLSFYIGQSVAGYRLDDSTAPEGEPSLDEALAQVRSRADVTASEKEMYVATQRVVSAQAGLFPTASLDGNYYTRRPGFQDGNDWDVTVKFDVPVFDVGSTLGDIKEAHALREQARLAARQALRSAELDVRDAYEDLRSSREADAALQVAAQAARENAELETADYRLNLVDNLDVLDALRRSLDIQRRANDAAFEAKKSAWRYRIARGELPA